MLLPLCAEEVPIIKQHLINQYNYAAFFAIQRQKFRGGDFSIANFYAPTFNEMGTILLSGCPS